MVTSLHPILALLFAPLLQGVIMKTKAFFAGRTGPPLFQLYYDLAKLFRKDAVFSETTTWIFRIGPAMGVATSILCLVFLPLGNIPSLVSFQGDLIFIIYLLALSRFFTVLAAMDTGSAFEGMGASREMTFSTLTEPTLFFCLVTLAQNNSFFSLTNLIKQITPALWQTHFITFGLVLVGLFLVFLTENSRIPIDDPTTHLELTMIHEVMVLDHCGVDLGLIEYAASLKLWILGSIIVGLAVPVRTGCFAIDLTAACLGLILLSICVGIIESTLARYRMNKIPLILIGACALSIVGFLFR